MLCLDDVQWADPASIELLCHLLAHPPPGPILVVLAYRPAQVPAPLSAALYARDGHPWRGREVSSPEEPRLPGLMR